MQNIFKYIYVGLGLIAVFALASCDNGTSELKSDSDNGWHQVEMNLIVSKKEYDSNGDTRATAGQWKNGDTLYLLFTGNNEKTVEGSAVFNSSTGKWTVNYYGTLNRNGSSKVKAYYFDVPESVTSSSVTLGAHTGVYSDTDATYSYSADGTLNVVVDLNPTMSRMRFKGTPGTQFTLSGIRYSTSYDRKTANVEDSTSPISVTVQNDGYSKYVYGVFEREDAPYLIANSEGYTYFLECPTAIFKIGESGWMNAPTAQNHNGWMNYVPLTGVALSKSSLTLIIGGSETLTATFTPSNASYRDVTWASSNTSVATVVNGKVTGVARGTATITATSSKGAGVKATCTVTVIDTNGHAFVDLGLPSGILWATCNVGATKAEDYGDYYAWGETTTKSTYTKDNYTYTDNPTTLPLSADVAHVKWGGNWRMPTAAEIGELISNCTTTWTTQNGVNGRKVTSKTNGNSIFLPATGYFGSSLTFAGSDGRYCSSSLYTSDTSVASYLNFNSSYFGRNGYGRSGGQSVRPVCSK